MRARVLSRWAVVSTAAIVVAALALAGTASARSHVARAGKRASHYVGSIAPSGASEVDCNGWSDKYTPARPAMRGLCTDPIHISPGGKTSRLIDNGWYVGHDEPSVKFLSGVAGSGNTMTYYTQLPVDPSAAPTASGSVTHYGELSVAPWFGLPMCDPNSYPQNPCTADSNSNSGGITDSKAAGSAFMELQLYPPGFTPFIDSESCSTTQWCSALTIDSLECSFNFASCNLNCEEPVNFSFLQTDGVPSGPAAPQDPNINTYLGNAHTLKMNPGDVLKVSITDPASGFTTTIDDLTTGQTGFMQASAANGFADTNMSDCSGTPFTWHAEYSTAAQQNQVPWAAAEGGVLMEQEIGHYESCDSVANQDPYSTTYTDKSSYSDPNVFQTCDGGREGPSATGEGPCNAAGTSCTNPTTQGVNGPAACPTTDATTGALCEFSDGYCFPAGSRTVSIDKTAATESSLLNGCFQDQFQNGDLDFDGTGYQTNAWPDGTSNTPTSMRYVGPFTASGAPYPRVQYESDVGGSSALCNTQTGQDCTVAPIGANFYPFWSLNYSQKVAGVPASAGSCVWNFGNDISGVTNNDIGQDGQYGSPDVARYGGTIISGVRSNPALQSGCGAPTATSQPTISTNTAEQGQTLTASPVTWSNGSTAISYQWSDCDSSGANCTPISAATSQTYTPVASDIGQTLRVQESVPGVNGTIGRATSAPTAPVAEGPPQNTAPPTISGNTTQGQTLTEGHGAWTNSPAGYTYQWEDCNNGCTPISGATGQTYTLTSSDVGRTIVVQETASNTSGPSSTPASSSPSAVVLALNVPPVAPSNTSPPAISGTDRVGSTLSSLTGLWSGTPPLAYTYQWQLCNPGCANITGATSASYTLVNADSGQTVRVLVTATNSVSGVQAPSAQTATIAPSVGQLKTLLGKLIVPHGHGAKISTLLSKHGSSVSFTAPGAGLITISWKAKSKGKTVLVAKARLTLHAAGGSKIKIALTKQGRTLLKATAKHLAVSATGKFTPPGFKATTVSKKFTLKH